MAILFELDNENKRAKINGGLVVEGGGSSLTK